MYIYVSILFAVSIKSPFNWYITRLYLAN